MIIYTSFPKYINRMSSYILIDVQTPTDANHVPHDPPVASDPITITVE